MKLLVAYATTEGQTRKIARQVADRLVDGGNAVELITLADAFDIDLNRFDRVILAASIHIGHYQKELAEFVEAQRESLRSKPSLLLSVSLSAAGHEAEDWRGLERIAEDFETATGWIPGRLLQVAGAYTPSSYDLFRRFIMRRIISSKDPDLDTDADKEYTDWSALFDYLDDWLKN